MTENILRHAAQALGSCKGVLAVVLGGSRASGIVSEGSDIDIGVYYSADAIDFDEINRAVQTLDDERRAGLVCGEGGWGGWVNCGGWLRMNGAAVDIILRDWNRVLSVLDETDQGIFSNNYQPGHPHAYQSAMYRGELASCRVLRANSEAFIDQKKRAEFYPPALRSALIDFFLFEADFSCGFLANYAYLKDTSYLAGHAFRAVSALNQVLFALNSQWLLNEKKAAARAAGFHLRIPDYKDRIDHIFRVLADNPHSSAEQLRSLVQEARQLCSGR